MDKSAADSCPRCNSRHLKDLNSMSQAEREEFISKFSQSPPLKCQHGKCCDCGWIEGQDNRDTIRRGAKGSGDKKGERNSDNS